MITFRKNGDILILNYSSENRPWLIDEIKNKGFYKFSNTFYLTKNELTSVFKKDFIAKDEDYEDVDFHFGTLKGEYYEINKNILSIKNNLYIHKKIKFEKKLFVAQYKISIFRHIDNLLDEPIYIGGENKDSISYEDFRILLKNFPNTIERQKYCSARLSSILSSYFESRKDAIEKYEKYMNKKKSIQGKNLFGFFKNYEKSKYEVILKKLKNMLKSEKEYNEKQWQKEIIEILKLIFPKYIKVFSEVEIKDFYKNTSKYPDYLLIDAEGYIDIVEIKRPLACQIVSRNTYRDNHYPIKELSGTVMQVEKYILHLNKSGQKGEDRLNRKYKEKLPSNFDIKITNPGAMIILGRSNNLNEEQKKDFEVIKRKYKNIIDIITYDDLIKRLEHIITQYDKV